MKFCVVVSPFSLRTRHEKRVWDGSSAEEMLRHETTATRKKKMCMKESQKHINLWNEINFNTHTHKSVSHSLRRSNYAMSLLLKQLEALPCLHTHSKCERKTSHGLAGRSQHQRQTAQCWVQKNSRKCRWVSSVKGSRFRVVKLFFSSLQRQKSGKITRHQSTVNSEAGRRFEVSWRRQKISLAFIFLHSRH